MAINRSLRHLLSFISQMGHVFMCRRTIAEIKETSPIPSAVRFVAAFFCFGQPTEMYDVSSTMHIESVACGDKIGMF
jgi:O-succinylbenzoate synthase